MTNRPANHAILTIIINIPITAFFMSSYAGYYTTSWSLIAISVITATSTGYYYTTGAILISYTAVLNHHNHP